MRSISELCKDVRVAKFYPQQRSRVVNRHCKVHFTVLESAAMHSERKFSACLALNCTANVIAGQRVVPAHRIAMRYISRT